MFVKRKEVSLPEMWNPVSEEKLCKACGASCPDAALFVRNFWF